MHPLAEFVYLQALDFLTTVAVLASGLGEGNPIVRWVLYTAPSPLGGLLAVKLLAVALAVYCWRRGRLRLLFRMNVLFAAVVVWNLVALILRSATVF